MTWFVVVDVVEDAGSRLFFQKNKNKIMRTDSKQKKCNRKKTK
jgi:hypothetical protein